MRKDDMTKRILEKARERFFEAGFTKVTMDEIASDLGISKKTLYRLYPSKERLIAMAIDMTVRENAKRIRAIVQDRKLDFIEKLRRIMGFLGIHVSRIGEFFLRDLRRLSPTLWKQVEQFRRKQIFLNMQDLLEEGMERGMLRRDISPQIFVLMYANLVQSLINPDVLSKVPFTVQDMFDAILKVSLEGILTEKGRTLMKGRGTP